MKRSSSNCFRVSILRLPHLRWSGKGLTETNHEQTLSVRYVFRNHLIWREQPEIGISPLAGARDRGPKRARLLVRGNYDAELHGRSRGICMPGDSRALHPA